MFLLQFRLHHGGKFQVFAGVYEHFVVQWRFITYCHCYIAASFLGLKLHRYAAVFIFRESCRMRCLLPVNVLAQCTVSCNPLHELPGPMPR